MATQNRRASRLVLVILSALALCVSVLASPVAAGTVTAPVVTLTPGNTTMQVNWTAATTTGGATITGYTASISPDPGGVSPVALGAGVTTHTFTGLATGTSHLVTITATDSDTATASGSNTASTTTPASTPSAPTNVAISQPTAGTASITWNLGATNGANVTGHTVILSATAGGAAVNTQTVAGGTTTATSIPGLAAGTYFARVRTTSSDQGNSGYTQSAGSITVAPAASAPSAPTGVAITQPTAGTAAVSWTLGATNGATVTGHTVILSATAGGAALNTQIVAGATTTSTSISGLAAGTYFARVRTTSSDQGNSGYSQSAGSITVASPATLPAVPTITGTPSVSGGSVTVNFTVPTMTGPSAPESYRVRLLAGDGSVVTTAQPSNAQVGIGGADLAGTWTLSTSVSGQYSIDVASTNAAGTSSPATVSGITVAIAPGPPTSVGASSNADKVTITWTAPNTTGGSIGSYEIVFNGKTTIVNAPTTTLTVSGVPAGTYTATVKAVNTVPLKSSAASSNSVTVIVAADAPTNVKGVATGQTVVVTWNAPANSGGSPVESYKATLNGVNKTVNGTIRTATFTNVPFGEHVATVVATTGVGAGATASSPTIDVKRAFEPFNTDKKFVEQLYRDILGRNADAGGRDYWAGLINGDPNKVSTVVEAFLNSPEFGPRRPIIRLYLAYFNRAPDAGGFDYWTNLYVGRTVSLLDASHLFSTSPEFSQTYGNLSNGQFVVLVYNNVLGRSPDVEGYNWWVNKLSQGLSRAGMMIEFSESAEFLKVSKNFVDITMVYRGMLIRIPKNPASTNEFNVWLPRLAGSETIDDLIMDIFNGDEYEARVTP